MKIVFLYFSINATLGFHQGIAALVGILENKGGKIDLEQNSRYDVDVLTLTNEEDYIERIFSFIRIQCNSQVDVIAISVVQPQLPFILTTIQTLQLSGLAKIPKIVVGGPYVTLNPQFFMNLYVDAIVIGEADEKIKEIMDNVVNDLSFTPKLIKCPLPNLHMIPLIEDRTKFPVDAIINAKNRQLEISIGRGCMYNCSYCSNYTIMKQMDVLPNEYVRMKSFHRIFNEIEQILKVRPDIEYIAFTDDDFFAYYHQHARSFEVFLEIFLKRINKPFIANINPISINENRLCEFKRTGGAFIRIGVEACERLRYNILNRMISDELLFLIKNMCNHLEIELSTYNMIGLPTECKDDVHNLAKLNAQLQPAYIKLMIYYPFENTTLYYKHKPLIDLERLAASNYQSKSVLNFDKEYHEFLETMLTSFHLLINYYLLDLHIESKYEYISPGLFKRVDDLD